MTCGTPVIASIAASLPEVVGDAGVLVDPLDTNQLAQAISRVLSSPDLRAQLRQRGLVQAQKFSWENTLALTRLAIHRYE
jgi:glycosyltransferase involved in cell wall biosynthesis